MILIMLMKSQVSQEWGQTKTTKKYVFEIEVNYFLRKLFLELKINFLVTLKQNTKRKQNQYRYL